MNPLTLLLTREDYVYLRGKGAVTLPGGGKAQMSVLASQVRLKTVLEPVARHFPDDRPAVASGPAPSFSNPGTINDLIALKLFCRVVRLDQLGLLPVPLSPEARKSVADCLTELHERYRIGSRTAIHSDVATWGCQRGADGLMLFVEMKKRCEILHVKAEG